MLSLEKMQEKEENVIDLDVIIVGGGIAGLYCAYLCRKHRPEWRVLVLEKNASVGGRMGTYSFQGVPVPIGAGIGRQKKDKRLQKLLAEMQIPTTPFKAANGYSAELASVCGNLKKTFLFLKKIFQEQEQEQGGEAVSSLTFKDFARPLLGPKAYKQFITCAGYTDYERAGAADVFTHYSFQDNYDAFDAFGVPWQQLLDKLVAAIGPHRIQTGATVVKIVEDEEGGGYMLEVNNKKKKKKMLLYRCTKVVLATTVEAVRRLCPKDKDTISLYRQIHSQPFLRIYGKFTKQSMARMKEYMLGQRTVVVSGPIHKIITMNEAAGVVMVAYTDNAGALALKKTKANRAMLCRLLERALGAPSHSLKLVAMVHFYWQHGTHYYAPLRNTHHTRAAFIRAAQRPRRNFFVGGEMVSLHQGWVEGALESIDKISADLFF